MTSCIHSVLSSSLRHQSITCLHTHSIIMAFTTPLLYSTTSLLLISHRLCQPSQAQGFPFNVILPTSILLLALGLLSSKPSSFELNLHNLLLFLTCKILTDFLLNFDTRFPCVKSVIPHVKWAQLLHGHFGIWLNVLESRRAVRPSGEAKRGNERRREFVTKMNLRQSGEVFRGHFSSTEMKNSRN